MILKMFTVYDSKLEAYLQPFYMATAGLAVRAFADIVADKTHAFSKHPADYTLFEIGSYDDRTGLIVQLPAHKNLGTALEYSGVSELNNTVPHPSAEPLTNGLIISEQC